MHSRLSTVDLLGHSMGGEVAQMLALQRRNLVRRLILVGARTATRRSPRNASAHSTAARVFGQLNADGYAELRRIAPPALIVNGSDDIVIPTVNSFIL